MLDGTDCKWKSDATGQRLGQALVSRFQRVCPTPLRMLACLPPSSRPGVFGLSGLRRLLELGFRRRGQSGKNA